MKKYIYDIETFKYIFCVVFKDVSNGISISFEISSRKNEWSSLKVFLEGEIALIGFNNIGFDYPVLHKMLKYKGVLTSKIIHEFSQEVISSERATIYNPLMPQLDLFLIHHYDNSARSCSLKWLEFTTRWYKVQDLPFKHDEFIPELEFDNVVKYCHNDVDFTHKLYEKSLSAIKFRVNTTKKLNHNVMNYSDVKIGEYINQVTYEKTSNRDYKSFKNNRTERNVIYLKYVVEDNIEYKTEYLQNFLKRLKTKSFIEGSDDKSSNIDSYLSIGENVYKFAKGGLHSEDKPRIVKRKLDYLQEKDVASYYPASIVNSKLYPEHLGIVWYNGVKNMFNRRTHEIKPLMKTLDKESIEYQELDVEQAGIKLSLNGGKTKNNNQFVCLIRFYFMSYIV